MATELPCDQCSATFEANFELYNHKVKEHGPTMAIVSNPNLKRGPKEPEPGDHPSKYVKVDHIGGQKRDRYESDDESDANPSKYAKLNDKQGVKRYHVYDSDDGGQATKFRKLNDRQGIKRKIRSNHGKRKYRKIAGDETSSSSDEDHALGSNRGVKRGPVDEEFDPSGKRRKYDTRVLRHNRTLTDKLKSEVARYKKLYMRQKRKAEEYEKECEKKIDLFKKQIKEMEELDVDGDFEMNTLTNAVINSVTIQEFNEIRKLIQTGQLSRILRTKKHIQTLQTLFLGLIYGVIPITQPQRIALSENERHMIRKLENASIGTVRSYIQSNKDAFIHLFGVINDSIKLITRSYERYGLN